jgi:hypothetical protein
MNLDIASLRKGKQRPLAVISCHQDGLQGTQAEVGQTVGSISALFCRITSGKNGRKFVHRSDQATSNESVGTGNVRTDG